MRSAIPPLAGLVSYEEAARVGYGVERNVELLRRYNFVETRLYELTAAMMNPTPEWEVKCALSLHLWLDAEHSRSIRDRVAELRKPPLLLDRCPDERLEAFMDEVRQCRTTVELLAGVYGVLRPALLSAYRTHLAETNPLIDHPTARLLRIALPEESQMIEWGQQALDAVRQTAEASAESEAWQAHLLAYLDAAGGIAGEAEVPTDLTLPTSRAAVSFVPDVDPKRDPRSGDIYNFHYRANDVYLDERADWDERNLALMFKRFHEMDVPEMMVSIILQTKGKPWDYYREMARQLWDEARHAMMGEVWFASKDIDVTRYPNHVGWAMHLNLDRSPIERHIILFSIEQSLMDGQVGKKLEWEIAQHANDPLATYFQDYDWADEVLHAQIGRRWLKPDVGDVKEILARAREIANRRAPTFEARSKNTPQIDWWGQFVHDALGKPSTSDAGIDSGLIPTIVSASG